MEKAKEIGAHIMDEYDIYPILADDNGYKEKEKEHLQAIIDEADIEKLQQRATKYANQEVRRATYQAMEAFVHNLNTMHSRAGAQIPFSSINYGTDTSPEGRMIIENILLATEAGLGNGETSDLPYTYIQDKRGHKLQSG